MKPSDRVNRIQNQEPKGATIRLVQGFAALIDYDEGGEGWWPLECLELDDPADWSTFKGYALQHAGVNAAIAAAIPAAPAAALALPSALLQCEAGKIGDFAACWRAVAQASHVSPDLIAELVGVAQSCQLPEAFITALTP